MGVQMNGLGWFLAGLNSEIYNAKQLIKAPFRHVLKEKYTEKMNEKKLMESFVKSSKDISIFSKHSSYIHTGSGQFTLYLLEEYKRQGKKVKLITTGSRHDMGKYFSKSANLTMTEINIEESENYDEIFSKFVENDDDILSLNKTYYGKKEKPTDEKFYQLFFSKLAALPKTDTIYLVPLLFVYEKEISVIKNETKEMNIRFINFNLALSGYTNRIKKENINIYISHHDDYHDDEEIYKESINYFKGVPRKFFKKNYYPYQHFIYSDGEKTGVHFMESKEKK